MMDWCDKDAPAGARDDLFKLIKATPMLGWQLLTKRATLIKSSLPDDWGSGYQNVWLGVTVENMKHGFPRLQCLKEIPASLRFISAEPLLEDISNAPFKGIDWIIIGGESGPGCRPMMSSWVHNLLSASHDLSISVWFKQWGGNAREKSGFIVNDRIYNQWPQVNTLHPEENVCSS